MQINKQKGLFAKSHMTVEKLQLIATTSIKGKFQARWLRWWN